MPKIISFELSDDLNIIESINTLDPVTNLPVLTGVYRSVQPHQLEKHLIMFEPDMTAAQKTKAAAIIARVKAK